jgi:hypothetical protein
VIPWCWLRREGHAADDCDGPLERMHLIGGGPLRDRVARRL